MISRAGSEEDIAGGEGGGPSRRESIRRGGRFEGGDTTGGFKTHSVDGGPRGGQGLCFRITI